MRTADFESSGRTLRWLRRATEQPRIVNGMRIYDPLPKSSGVSSARAALSSNKASQKAARRS
jgi:hypothetical protein